MRHFTLLKAMASDAVRSDGPQTHSLDLLASDYPNLHALQAGSSAVERIQAAVKEAETTYRPQEDGQVIHNASADFTPVLPELRYPNI